MHIYVLVAEKALLLSAEFLEPLGTKREVKRGWPDRHK